VNVLLQHPFLPGQISGVVAYLETLKPKLEAEGACIRILPSATASLRDVKAAVDWADIIHLNSGELRAMLLAKCSGKPIVQEYHFPFWGTWQQSVEDRKLPFGACLKKTVSVVWSHGLGWRLSWNFFKYFGSSCLRLAARIGCAWLADALVVPSQFMARDIRLPLNVKVIPYFLDVDDHEFRTNSDNNPKYSFCFAGRMSSDKGPHLILKAAGMLLKQGLNPRLVFIGDGEFKAEAMKLSSELGLDGFVEWIGKLPRSEVLEYMRQSMVVVVPSQWDDPSPFVMLEAGAMRKPVIGSNRGGIPEVLPQELIFQEDDVAHLAHLMKKLLVNSKERQRLGNACHLAVSRRCSRQNAVIPLLRLYQRVLSG